MTRSTRGWIPTLAVVLTVAVLVGTAVHHRSRISPRTAAVAATPNDDLSDKAISGPPAATPDMSSAAAVTQALVDESRRLHACQQLLARSESQLEQEQRRIAGGFEELARARGVAYDPASADRELQAMIAAKLGQRRDCQALAPDTIATWWDLLERAAVAGNLQAMEDYGHLVVNASGADDLFDRIDEMARRKRLAYGFMRRVAASGNCMVSGDLEILSPDSTRRYAFALVSVEVTRRFNDALNPEATADNVRFMQSRADRAAAGLDDAQAADARRLASQVVAACRNP